MTKVVYESVCKLNNGTNSRRESGQNRLCPGCGRPCLRKYCSTSCYRIIQRSLPVPERFWAKVKRGSPEACWPWGASRAGGRLGKVYGQFTATIGPGKQRAVAAHVFAYELTYGPVPVGLEVAHTCHNPVCCNPRHLTATTHGDNVRMSAEAGHLHVPRPRRQKLTDGDIETMIAMRASGLTLVQIAAHYDVTKSFVSLICTGKRRQYRHQPSRQAVA